MKKYSFTLLDNLMAKNKGRILLYLLVLFLPISIIRFLVSISRGWNLYCGELISNFPFFFRLQNYNLPLYNALRSTLCPPWVNDAWFYGPIHHLWLFPLTFLVHDLDTFFRSLLIVYIFLVIFSILFLYQGITKKNQNYLFLLLICTITLGSFPLLDNLIQRNVELLELFLIAAAFLHLKRNHNYFAGGLLCLAAMSKLLPFVFLPYLIVKRKFKVVIGFLSMFILIAIINQISLQWKNCEVFNYNTMKGVGAPSLDVIFGTALLQPISHCGGSLYTFIQTFITKIDMSTGYMPIIIYKTNDFFIINWLFFFLAFSILVISLYVFFRTGKDGNILYEFSIVSLMMLLLSPHTNPHYYIFILFALISIVKMFLYDLADYHLSFKSQVLIYLILIFCLLGSGNLIPLVVYEKIFPLKNMAFHYFATYSIFGLVSFVLWCLMVYIYYIDYRSKKISLLHNYPMKKPFQ